jgi:DNA-binding protein Alba
MEKYKRVKQNIIPADNEVRVNRDTPTNNYVKYVMTQFNECGAKKVSIVAMGDAIYKVITIAELVRYRVKQLHQINEISQMEFRDEYLPLEEGLDKLVFKRKVACLSITLIMNGGEEENIDKSFYGY